MSTVAPPLELCALGVPALRQAGQALHLPLQRGWALLAYLAWHPGPLPRSHLATLLWPEAPAAAARTRLRRMAYAVEQQAGRPLFQGDAHTLALRPGVLQVDALAFAELARQAIAAPELDGATLAAAQAAAESARAPLLHGIHFGSAAFDDWLQSAAIEHEQLLARLLERLADTLGRRGELASALAQAEALVALDPYREPSHVLLMRLHAQQCDRAGVEAAYARCAELLRAEFGIRPGPQTEQAWLRIDESMQPSAPQIRYAQSGAGAVAYTVLGRDGPPLLLAPGFVCHIEIALEHPPLRRAVEALAGRFRVILFDRRGVGLSERLEATPTPAALAADMRALLDHAGFAQAWVFGSSEGGMGAMQLAIDHPRRVLGLCLCGALARGAAAPDYPWALPAPAYEVWLQRMVAGWGGPVGIETFAPSAQRDPAVRAWWARLVRHAVSPGGLRSLLAGLRDADLRADLPRIAVPTLVMHRRGDRAVRFDAGRHLAQAIPGAQWLPLDGDDHFWWCGDGAAVVDAVLRFSAG